MIWKNRLVRLFRALTEASQRDSPSREEATMELASQALRYLFRARYDQGLRFSAFFYEPPGQP